MIIIGERELGDSVWVRAAQLDKENMMERLRRYGYM